MDGSLLKGKSCSSWPHGCVAATVCLLVSVITFHAAAQSKGFVLGDSVAPQGRRLALVIGNKDYSWKPLANPVNDAIDVAAALERDGFKVHLATNLRFRDPSPAHEMKSVVRQFVESVHKNDFAFVYYSGHGVEVRGTNYLLPIDLPADATAGTIRDEAIAAQDLVSDLQDQGASVSVIVLDACRSNPIHANSDRAMPTGGLARMEPGHGTLVVFPTQAGQTASDNSNSRNGLFTQYLLPALAQKGVRLDDAIRDAASQMVHDTGGSQTPALYGLLDNPVFLASAPEPVPAPAPVNVQPMQSGPDAALEAWMAIKDTHNPQDFDDFITAFPQSPYAASARLVANRLRREAAKASSASPPPSSNPNASSSRSSPDVPRSNAGPGPSTLVVSCDLACRWQVDGAEQGTIQPGNPGTSPATPGDHVVTATTLDGRDRLSQSLTAVGGTRTAVSFSLKQAHDVRIDRVKEAAEHGLEHFNEKEYTNALPALQEACTGGDAPSCRTIGFIYSKGLGVTQDYKKAADFYTNGCDLGDMPGCMNLGYLYKRGYGVTQDAAKTSSLYKQSCDGGELLACDSLGIMYANAEGVAQDYPQAFSLFKKACDGGDLMGCTSQGAMYVNGTGVAKDDSQAFSLFKKACDANSMVGCRNLGEMYRTGRSVPVDQAKARQLYDQACKGGDNDGCKVLASLKENTTANVVAPKPEPVPPAPASLASNTNNAKAAADRGMSFYSQKDYQHALPAFQEACTASDGSSCRLIGFLYFRGLGVTRDFSRSAEYFKKGCDLGDLGGCNNLGALYENGQGVKLDDAKALALYRQACNGGVFGACNNLATRYESAHGVQRDYNEAFSLFKRACDGKEWQACDGLGDMYRLGHSVPVNLERARQLYDTACKGGNDDGCKDLKALDK
jgi:hypothetical protein